MAELTNLGAHCFWPECHQLDFLPVTCVHCKKQFCKEHYPSEAHQCQDKPDNVVEDISSLPAPDNFPCSVNGCQKSELAPITCSHCKIQVCLSHRYQQSHQCREFQAPSHTMTATKALVDQIVHREVSAKQRKPRSKAAQRTAAKVQLMKLKQKSVGVSGVPHSERVYFLVSTPSGKSCGCWVSSTWSIGRVVDSLAEHTGTANNNNVAGAKRLKGFRAGDGKGLCHRMDRLLSELVQGEEVFDGDSLLLAYVEEDVDDIEL